MSDKDEQHGLRMSYLCTCNKNQLVRKHTFYSKVCFRTKIQISKMKLFNESLTLTFTSLPPSFRSQYMCQVVHA